MSNTRQKNKSWSTFMVHGIARDHDLDINDVHRAFGAGFDAGLKEGLKTPRQDKEKYIYFISYTYSGGNGNCFAKTNRQIISSNLDTTKKNIENKTGLKDVVINNFILLDE